MGGCHMMEQPFIPMPRERIVERAVDPRWHRRLVAEPAIPDEVLRRIADASPDPEARRLAGERLEAARVAALQEVRRARRRRWLLVGTVGVVVVAVIVAAAMVLPGWLGRSSDDTSSEPPAGTTAVGDARNGFEFAWRLDLATAVPEIAGANFVMNPKTDDPWSNERFGPLTSGPWWGLPLWGDDGGGGFLVVDAETGDLARTVQGAMEDCDGFTGGFACVTSDGRLLYITADSEREVAQHTGHEASYAVAAAGDGVVVLTAEATSMTLTAYGSDGATLWEQSRAMADGWLAFASPLEVDGEHVVIQATNALVVYGVADGHKEFSTGEGSSWLGDGVIQLGEATSGVQNPGGLVTVPYTERFQAWTTEGQTRYALRMTASAVSICTMPEVTTCVTTDDTVGAHVTDAPRLASFTADGRELVDVVTGGYHVIVDPATGTTVSTWPEPDSVASMRSRGPRGVVAAPARGGGTGFIREAETGSLLGVPPTDWYPVTTMPEGYLALVHVEGRESWNPVTELAVFRPATRPTPMQIGQDATAVERPAELPACPEGEFDLAWGTLDDGWVLVCGATLTQPSVWIQSVGGQEERITEVSYGGVEEHYHVVLPDGGVRMLTPSPGTLAELDQDGQVINQQALTSVYFVVFGRQRPTTGAFDVRVPERTSQDQARYLSEIIISSKEARSSLQEALAVLNQCSNPEEGFATQIDQIDAVTRNREQLLQALASAPVDLIPEGPQLVNELRQSLIHSRDADEAFATWARALHAGGCGAGSSAEGIAYSEQATAAKTVFTEHWNRVVAPQFDVPTVTNAEL